MIPYQVTALLCITWNPPPPPLNYGGEYFQKMFLLGDRLLKVNLWGGGVFYMGWLMIRMGYLLEGKDISLRLIVKRFQRLCHVQFPSYRP